MQDLRLKINGAQLANIEIVPCSDGSVDIIVHKQEQAENKPYKNKKSNVDILKDFCSKQKEYEDVDLKQLKSFYNFYEKRAQEWKGTMDCEKLFNNWMDKAYRD